ncbi:MAG: hypothetical protein KKH40_04505, partial [Nanoarchaeota archaeon]|nr:hypothetical protein [Nanoarchaeota archaeon]
MNCLENIGLSKGEIKVYEAILDIGTSTINKIQEITVIERRNIYDIINKLIHKGLISYTVEKGKKTYRCTHPNKILSYLEEKKNNIEKEEENIRKELPKIIEKFKLSKPAISAQTFIGKEGIKAIFEEILNYKKSYFIGGGWYVIKELPYFWSHYNEKRIEK